MASVTYVSNTTPEPSKIEEPQSPIPVIKRSRCWWCPCRCRKPKHDREFTQWEIDYVIQIRAKEAFKEDKKDVDR